MFRCEFFGGVDDSFAIILAVRNAYLPNVAPKSPTFMRKTSRLAQTLHVIGLACGGEGGSRLARRLGMPTSPESLLRSIRGRPLGERPTPRILGVDDWAFRRGQRYGTILCDLELHQAIELLPKRSSTAFAHWLHDHPGVEVVSRDRGDYYIKGGTEGTPWTFAPSLPPFFGDWVIC